MIIGIGHDITSLPRMEKLLESSISERFMERILTDGELLLARGAMGKRLIEFTAGRFAAKEAVSKAFGCGIGRILSFRDIEVGRNEQGKPICQLSDGAWERLGLKAGAAVIHVTITHDESIASAFVVVEQTLL
ncbi:Holo-[acyl-carrier-protein] synthase [Paenibacillus plantiphilus]|uniref:Holo-[acyl-carrier-protein] synthase n=1 Tax=Paenibacillus plantiphilus TaxID=2905650 RepID=A0ABN8GS95_9BACL|nr:holo-ACP synthase [Paenibacillus plantiphilus]CAH1216768.1 Holo-[acyl-carrier-protein] synthase [Paenibacillus plantiphilus]